MPFAPQNNLQSQFVTESTSSIGFPWRLFLFSTIIFLFSLFVYFGIKFGYGAYLETRARDLDRDIENLANRVSEADQERFLSFYSQLANLKQVINGHYFTANVFSFLEKNTLPNVYFRDARFTGENAKLELRGEAENGDAFIAQLALFDSRPEVVSSVLESVRFSDAAVDFSLTLIFSEDFFDKPQ